jgi:hypothetical protein
MSTQSWLADHSLIGDTTSPFTLDPNLALRFSSVEVASQRARMILHLYPDLVVDHIQMPLFL